MKNRLDVAEQKRLIRKVGQALFVFNQNLGKVPYENRSTLIDDWELELEFVQVKPRISVNSQTVDIDWCKPRFRLHAPKAQVLPAYNNIPKGKKYTPNRWHNIDIQYA